MPVYVQQSLIREEGVDVRPIGRDDAVNLVLNVHYARRVPPISHAYGLFVDGTLMGCVTYGIPASDSVCRGLAGEEYRLRVLELNRLVVLDGAPKNSASTLVGRFLRMLPRGMYVISYADYGGWGHVGYVYQATNWLYTGKTKERTDQFAGENRHPRHAEGADPSSRTIRTEKHRYLFVTAHGRERGKMIRRIRWPIYDHYPKGDTRRYDVDDPRPANGMVGKALKEE